MKILIFATLIAEDCFHSKTIELGSNNTMRSKMLAENVNFLILSSYIGVMNDTSFTLKMSTVRLATIFISYLFHCTSCEDFTEQMLGKSRDACMRISKDPFFDIDIVIGKPWRIYYTWNMKLDTKCLDMKFKNVTQEIIKRVWSDMNDYLEQQPYWEAATLHLSMGSAAHELLLFADQGAAGTFLGVPNIIRDPNIKPLRKGVPLLKFQMKLLRGGKYLLVMDCHVGGASLAARPGNETYRSEVAAEAEALDLGDGYPACINERNNDEKFFLN